MSTAIFTAEAIEHWRMRATHASDSACAGDETANGWSVAAADPAVTVSPFELLAVRPGFRLAAYVYRSGGTRKAAVVALPAGETLESPPRTDVELPTARAALPDPMDAIIGDGSEESYLQASVLARELDAFCARGHSSGWRLHHVLDGDAWPDHPLTGVSPSQPLPSGSPGTWSWQEARPESFAPTVSMVNSSIVVTIFSYTAFDTERIFRHCDTYTDETYVPKREAMLIATGQTGFMI